ncbi:Rho GTPase activating protein, partial [Kickxella alabastrina]
MLFPEGIPAVDSDGSGDFPVSDDMDIIHIMQERDAYKQETEKLRKIIERQRFIIKSLQDQLARKQSASANNTPSAPGSEFSMDPLEQPELDFPKPVVENTPVADAVDRPANMASVALGLSSLSVSTPPKNGNAVRKVSQGSNTANLPQLPNGLAPIELTSVVPNIHPWTKSTRLSEIYADYSARHNSVSPMFKPSTVPWTQSGEEGQQHQQRARSASGSSFTESLKNSIRRTEWPSEWGNQQEQGENSYGGERGAGRQISGLVDDTSRGPSMTVSVDGDHRQETFIRTQPKHDSVFGTAVGNRNADYYATRRVETADPEPASQPADVTINEDDTERLRRSVGRVISSYSTKAPVVPLPVAPETNPTGQSYESADDEMFLRPASVAVHSNGAAVNGILAAASTTSVGEPEDDDNAWLPTDYEGVSNSNDEHVGNSSQQQQLRQSEDAFVEKAPIILTSQQYQEHQQQSLPEEFAWLQNQSPQQPQSQPQSQLQSRQLDQQNQQPLVDRPASPSFGPNSSKGNSWDYDTPIATPLTAAQSIGTPVTHGTNRQPYNNQQAPPAEKQNSYDFQDASRLSTSQNSGIQSPFPFAVQDSNSRYENNSSPAILLAKSAQNMSDAIFRQPALSSLENIDIQIKDSRIKVDERGKEINVYMIDVVFRKEISGLSLQEMIVDSQQPLIVVWTVEKRYSDFLNLHTSLRQVIGQEKLDDKLERLPDKDIFRANAPTKSDKRKLWFEKYLKKALLLSIKDQSPLLQFLSTDRTMEPEKKMPILLGHKEGFLVKRGKNFGGWKRRYYVCKSNKPVLEYSDSPGGSINGTINLSGAIVKMGKSRSDDAVSLRGKGNNKETDMFRHAFLILERPKREGKEPISHPLWAESDRERDEWVMALRYVIVREAEGPERAMKEVNRYVSYTKRKDSN